MIRVFDAFSGIGGFRSAFERVGGFKTVGWCEIDRFAQKSYRALFDTGGEQFYENIRDIDTAGLADFDLLVGGFPCQPFSVAGKRLGTADERGDLFFELARILEAKRPRYFIFENVPGLLGIEKGQTFKVILETLSDLGYCVEWLVHDSAGFGVPQSRKRVYLAGCLGVDYSGKILALGNCDEENSRKVKQLIGGSQGQRVYAPDGLAVTQCSGSGGMGGKTGLYLIDMNYPPTLTEKARCITARQDSGVSKHKGEHSAVFCDLNENPQITENARCLHTRYDLGVSSGKHKGERSGVLIEDGPRAILNPFKEEVYQNGRRVKEPNEPMFTLTVVDRHGIVHQGRIRRLMPIECWRLQGFTTEQFRKVEAAGLSDAQLYKQAGNAVTVNVVEAIARNLLKFDEEVKKSNHVTNIITYEGDRKQIAKMLEAIKNDELGIGTVDFQKIIPMPDDIYRGNLGRNEKELYGDKNWYDWSRANWGTKWNCYGYQEGFDYSQTESLWFQTAWSAPHPILQKLTEMFPEIEFKHQWADEDIGYNCGQHRYYGGERTDEFYPESEFDRIRFAAEVLEVDPEEYGLFLNETNTAFIQLPDEDFELIEVAGQTALFTENRYNDADVPMGLHCYQLRHSDDGANFISLERRVAVNFGGTVITKECIDLGREQCIEFDEETEPNFLGERCQMEDFIAGDYGQEEEIEMEVNPV